MKVLKNIRCRKLTKQPQMAAPVVINVVNCDTQAEREIVFELLLSLKQLLLDDESKRRRGKV